MRTSHRSLLALLGVSLVGIAAACGSSSNGNSNSNLGDDSGADSSLPETGGGGSDSGADADASTTTNHDGGTEAATMSDGASRGDASDGGILGANCPAVDAGTFAEAPHGPLPTVAYYGGPVMTNPRIVTFTFKDTPNAAALDALGASITSTPWFATVT